MLNAGLIEAATRGGQALLGSPLDVRNGTAPEITDDGRERHIGVEIEVGGLSLDDCVTAVHAAVGGFIRGKGPNAYRIDASDIGDLTVELDAEILQKEEQGAQTYDTSDRLALIADDLSDDLYRKAGELTTGVVPVEVVTAPLHIDCLSALDDLADDLRDAGATGTRGSLLAGFGLHLNPEIRSAEPSSIVRTLRAFMILEDVLWEDCAVDMTRRISPFISKFPEDYRALVIDPEYAPDLGTLIDDYIQHNPTRNRDLDMLPLFRYLDAPRVEGQIDTSLVNARPTFHYRLPNCDLDADDWSISLEWRRWKSIEALADNDARLADFSRRFLTAHRNGMLQMWPDTVRDLLSDIEL